MIADQVWDFFFFFQSLFFLLFFSLYAVCFYIMVNDIYYTVGVCVISNSSLKSWYDNLYDRKIWIRRILLYIFVYIWWRLYINNTTGLCMKYMSVHIYIYFKTQDVFVYIYIIAWQCQRWCFIVVSWYIYDKFLTAKVPTSQILEFIFWHSAIWKWESVKYL